MGLRLHPEQQKSVEDSSPSAPCALWPIDLKLTHVDCSPDTTLVHFQGQHLNVCELDYSILQVEIQNMAKTPPALPSVEVGELCLVEDVVSARWFRGQVQNRRRPDLYDVFLVDYGNVLSVDVSYLSSCSDDLFRLPPKIFCGFFSNVLPGKEHWDEGAEKYFSSLIGSHVNGYIQALLPHKVLILEVPDVNRYLSTAGLGKHIDTYTFLLLVEMLTNVPLKQSMEPVLDLLTEKPSGQDLSFKPSSLQGFENILSFYGPKFTAGKRLTVRVTAAVSPGTFHCQLMSMAADLSAMSLKLAATCASTSQGSLQRPVENLGLLCSVKGKDDQWCRGFVQFLPVNSRVRVLFVDYGYCEPVKVENVRRLPSDLLFTPIMAFPCSLACLNEKDEAVRTEQLGFLKRGLLGEVLHLEISGFNKEQNLYSVTLLSAEGNTDAEEKQVHHVPEQNKMEILHDNEEVLPPGSHYYYETTVIQAFNHSIQTKEIGSVFEGYVEHIINPNHFYIRTQKRNRHFEELMNKMANHFSTVKLEEDILVDPDLGTLCCAMYEKDMHYYRAIVTAVLEHGSEVFFIDFGNVEKVPHMLIKKIPEEFVGEPAFALSCSQVDVLPIGDCWTSANTEWFRQSTHQKVMLVRVVHLQKAKCIVDLYEAGKRTLRSISEVMTSVEQAEFWKYTPSMPIVVGGNTAYKKHAKKYNKQNEPKKGQSGTSNIMAVEQWVNVQLQTKQEQSLTKIKDGAEIPKVEMATNQTDLVKMAVRATFSPMTFQPGCEFAVSVSHMDSPADFWCQLPSNAPPFDKLMEDLQQFYSAHSIAVTTGVSCCVAKSPGDGRWSRACITGQFADGSLRVILVDFGVTIRTNVRELQAILPEYLELEGQSIRCSLYNIVEPLASPSGTGKWSPEACRSFKDFVLDNKGSLKCCVISQLFVRDKGLCNVVDLVSSGTQQSACRRLVEQGLVREVTQSTQLHPSAFAESFVFSSFGLCIGCQEQAYVTHVDRTEEMYLQLERNSQVMEELSEKVAAWSKKILRAKSGAVVGKLCLAKYYDGSWYRARTLRGQSPLHLSVFFVDYGNVYVVEKSNVMSLPRGLVDLLFTPMQAIRCSLARVHAKENYAEVNRWLEKTILNKLVRAEVVGKSEDGTFIVELHHGDVHVNEKVNELVASLAPKVNEKRKELIASLAPEVNKKRKELLASQSPKGREHVTSQSPKGREHVTSQSPKGRELVTSQSPKGRELVTSQSPKGKGLVTNQSPKGRELVASQSPKGTELVANQSPKGKELVASQSPKGKEHVASQSPKGTELVANRSSKGKELVASQSPKGKERVTSQSPKGKELVANLALKGNVKVQISYSEGKKKQRSFREQKTPRYGHKCQNRHHHIQSSLLLSSSSSSRSSSRSNGSTHSDLQETKNKAQHEDINDVEVEGNKSGQIMKQNQRETPLQQPPISFEIPTKLSNLPDNKVRPGLRALCYASHINTVASFFVQMQEDEPAILKMLEDINSELFKNTLKFNSSIELRINDVVFAKYKEDDAFYRAVVKDCRSNGPYKVEFIDYGNSAMVSREQTYPMSPEGLSQPRLSIPCSLVDSSVYDSDAAFTEALLGRGLMVHFIRRFGTQWEVEILEEDHVAMVTPDIVGCRSNATKTQETGAESLETVSPDCVGYLTNATETRKEGPASWGCPADTPERNSPHNVTLLSVLDNGDFYVRVEECTEMLSSLQSSLIECLGECRGVSEGQVREGLRCLMQSGGTGQWCRALIQDVALGQCRVFLIDYGTTEEVSISGLREVCDQLTLTPDLAVLCKWNNLGFPVDKGARLLLQKTIQPMVGEDIKLVFVSCSDSDAAWMVDIDMNGLFLIRQARKSSTWQWPPAEEGGSPRHPSEERGEGEADGESPLRPQRLSLTPVVENHAYSAFAAAVTTPSEFHVVLDDLLLVVSAVSAVLDDLVPETVASLPEDLLVPGSCCLVRCHALHRWCRAQVVQVGHALVLLCLVDYGHCLDVAYEDRSDIKSLPEELAGLPKVTYPCSLRGVEPSGAEGQWSEAAVVFFQECIIRRSLQLFFRDNTASDEDLWEVDILVDGTHVAVEMVEAGHAVYTDMMLGLRFKEESRRKYALTSPLAEKNRRKPALQSPLAEESLSKPPPASPLAEESSSKPAPHCLLAEESPSKPARLGALAEKDYQEAGEECGLDGDWDAETEASTGETPLFSSTAGASPCITIS